MVVLFSRLRVLPVARPDQPTFLEGFGSKKLACTDALEAADRACVQGLVEVTALEALLMEALTGSLAG